MTENIFKYANSGDLNGLNKALARGDDINAQNINGDTALILAAKEGCREAVKTLVFKKANINIQNNTGDTSLSWSIIKGFIDNALFLIENGANIDLADIDGNTPLAWATLNGNSNLVSIMIKKNVDINLRDNKGNTPIMKAIKKNYNDISHLLINNGAKLDTSNEDSVSAMQIAALECNIDILLLMIQKGGKINIRDKHGQTPIDSILKLNNINHMRDIINCILISKYARSQIPQLFEIFLSNINNDFIQSCLEYLGKECTKYKSDHNDFIKLSSMLKTPIYMAKLLHNFKYREEFIDHLSKITNHCDYDLLYKICMLKTELKKLDHCKPHFFKEIFIDEFNNFFNDISSIWGNGINHKDIETLLYDLRHSVQAVKLQNLKKDNEKLKSQIANLALLEKKNVDKNKKGKLFALNGTDIVNNKPKKGKYGRKSILDMMYAAKQVSTM